MKSILLFLASLAIVFAAVPSDLITSLPNLAAPLGTQYSGYINLPGTQKYMHYWFVQTYFGSPSTAPLVLWMNGGPGCSSMDGFFYEQGPFHFGSPDSNLTLVSNPWTWTNAANMIFLEAPVGVGFSYSNNAKDYTTNDTQTAQDNYNFLKAWFNAYPEYQANPFWISGESYAGIYVPTLANLVLGDSSINFQGILVGNGVTDYKYDNEFQALFPFMYYHALISTKTWNQFQRDCINGKSQVGCDAAVITIEKNMNDINIYDIYTDCYSTQRGVNPDHLPYRQIKIKERPIIVGEVPPCTDATQVTNYLNDPDVQSAIHVNQNLPYQWSICSNVVNYSKNTFTVVPIYEELIKAKKQILVYSGDVDGAVPYVGTEAWINSMNLPINSLWQEWFITDNEGSQVAGYVTYYQGLTFATVKGAGHMVPQYAPEAAYYMFTNFVSGKPL
jgi:carboxypeptidase C (cathepsin A)